MPDYIDVRQLLELNRFPDLLKYFTIRCEGMEITQGIQHFKADQHLADINDRGPDNSLRIVAAKPAWVRVYVRSFYPGSITGVTGKLKVYRRSAGFFWSEIAELNPEPPGTITAEFDPVYATERGNLGATLNFIVPAGHMCGNLRFEAKVSSPDGHTVTCTENVDVTLRQTLRMRIVPVAYNATDGSGNPLTLAAPTLAQAQATAAWSLKVYPVQSNPQITLTAAITLTQPLTGSPATAGGCAQSWINLNVQVAAAKTADGNLANTFYYGLVPSGVPLGANSGCASSGVTSGMQGNQITMAHEFGHALGFPHAPCGGVGASADPTFPAYEPYDSVGAQNGNIGEFGLDVNNGNILSPNNFRDFMGYCNPDWISKYNHTRSIQNSMLDPQWVCQDRFWWWDEVLYDPWWWLKWPDWPVELPERFEDLIAPVDPREPVISLIGVLEIDDRVSVRSVTRTRAVSTVHSGVRTELFAELLDDEEERIGISRIMKLPSHGHHCGCESAGDDHDGPAVFAAFIPTAERGESLRIIDADGKVHWHMDAPRRKPSPAKVRAKVGKDAVLELHWEVEKEDEVCPVWIRCTQDDAEPRVIFIGEGSGEAKLDLGGLRPGKAIIDAIVHDGFDAVTGKSIAVEIPVRAPVLAILHPIGRQTLEAGQSMRLHGIATSCDNNHADPERCRWELNGKAVAVGPDSFVFAPESGDHKLVFIAEDDYGKSSECIKFRTVKPGE